MSFNKLFQLLRGKRPSQQPGTGQGAAPVAFAPAGQASAVPLDRLDLQSAVIHHLEWCVLFNDHLGLINQSDTPPLRTLPEIDQSGLGLWLQRSAGRAPGRHPLFEELLREHRQFHELAEKALALAAKDRMDLASTLLNTDFERSRARVLSLLREMQKG
jgi:hypothetical protein